MISLWIKSYNYVFVSFGQIEKVLLYTASNNDLYTIVGNSVLLCTLRITHKTPVIKKAKTLVLIAKYVDRNIPSTDT